MEEEQAQAEAMSEEREEGRGARGASAGCAGLWTPCAHFPRHQLAVQDFGEGESNCWWLLLGYTR